MGSGRPPVWILIRAHLRRHPNKTAVLVLLAVVMVVVYARLFLTTDGPQEAVAADRAVAASPPAAGVGVSASRTGPAEARVRLDRPLIRKLGRNPFALGSDRSADPSSADGSSTSEAPSLDPAQQVRDAAAKLVLESTICGSAPLASISGRVVRPGDEIEGFVLERVEPTKVVLRRHEIRVILPLR